jgi:hypothetical protein
VVVVVSDRRLVMISRHELDELESSRGQLERIRQSGDVDHDCPSCGHACLQLERDLSTFMQTGSWHPDAVRGTTIDPNVPPATVRSVESTGAVVGVRGTQPEAARLAAELRNLARLVEHEGWIRHQERMRRIGLAVARLMGPRWSQRRRMIETGDDDAPAT